MPKAKRYSAQEKQEILDFIASEGRGGQTKAVEKFKVTAATIASWKKKSSGASSSARSSKQPSASKELRAIQELASVLSEIERTEVQLAKLRKAYQKAKAKL